MAQTQDAKPEAVSIEFREVQKRYPGQDKAAVDNLSFEVPAGEICVLVGPSGCGKTTAMRMINRLIDPTSGDILLGGQSVLERKPAELRREIGYAIQQIGLFPHQTIERNISTVPRLVGWDKPRIDARVEELLELVSLDPDLVRKRYPAQLSGGQRQRIGVARALAADPPLLLMDEPFGAIDPITRERLQNEFLRLQAEIRKTVVFVTHDIDEAIKMGDVIAVMQQGGHLAQFASPEDLLLHPANEFVEQFVGADRALKRLALQRVRDIDLWTAAQAKAGESVVDARRRIADADLDYLLLVDDDGRPLGWTWGGDLEGDTVPDKPKTPAEPIVELDSVLRDALAEVLTSESRYAPVVDGQGRVKGVLSIEAISQALGTEATTGHVEHHPTPQ
ncbi:MAG: ABC transporter ATP-binding protein [Thermoleophilaceae bacterium]|nr:ABC transporter ATP-binding protein [Thermoleophilaceae bacterium]